MPTEAEIFFEGDKKGSKLPILNPGDRPASFSSIQGKELIIYLVECASDNSCANIDEVNSAICCEDEITRELLIPEGGRKGIKVLKKGESHDIPIVTKNRRKAVVRITHK